MSARPEFLTTRGAWMRSRRIAQTAADYACAVERLRPSKSSPMADAIFATAIGVVLAVLLVYWLAR